MGFVREPLDVDFVVDPRPLTEDDKKAISDFIKADKLKRAKSKGKADATKSARVKKKESTTRA